MNRRWLSNFALILSSFFLLLSGSACSSGHLDSGANAGKSSPTEHGWQLIMPPIEKLRVGTIYRIDPDGVTYRAGSIPVKSTAVREGDYRTEHGIKTDSSLILAFLRGEQIKSGTIRAVEVQVSLKGVSRMITTDQDVDRALADFERAVGRYRANNRYYIVRETRAARSVRMLLSSDVLDAIGGEAGFGGALRAGISVRNGNKDSKIVDQEFSKPMLVEYLPERIGIVARNLAGTGPMFGRFPVTEPLQLRIPGESE